MKRKSLVFAVLAAAVSAAAVAAVSLAAGGGASARSVTFHLVEKGQAFHFVDNPPSGAATQTASLGDMFVFTSNLFTTGGKRAGVLGAYCVITAGGKEERSECTGSFSLAGGQLHAIVALRGEPRVTKIGIIGGTGAYEGARGSIVSVTRKSNDNISDDTVHLLLP